MAMFHVVVTRSGYQYDPELPIDRQARWAEHAAFMNALVDERFILLGGPLGDDYRVVHAVEAESEREVRARFAQDPWSETHVRVEAVEPWAIVLDAREAAAPAAA